MRILAVGDVVSSGGCAFLERRLPQFKRENKIELCIINGENSAEGNGITPESARRLLDCGADVITTGNHALRRREIYDMLDSESSLLLRPANFHPSASGTGATVIDKGFVKIAVINIIGTVYLDNNENPFDCADRLLAQMSDCRIKLVDFHAEATSEKRAMGFYLDGRVSAVFGTHTHVQSSDAQILPKGTGYITDLGMTGAENSVLGVKPELVIRKLKTNLPVKFENPDSECKMEGCIFDIDNKTGKALAARSVRIY